MKNEGEIVGSPGFPTMRHLEPLTERKNPSFQKSWRLHPLKNTDYAQAKALLAEADQKDLATFWYWREPASVCLKWYGQVVGFCLIARDVRIVGAAPDWFQELQTILHSQHPPQASLPSALHCGPQRFCC